jgi:methyltransferase (TIGR00027 family)
MMVAAYRARATSQPNPILVDPWAAALAGDEGDAIARAYDTNYPHMELWVAVRVAWLDRLVREYRGAQVVHLGAGFDTRPARLARAGLRFFEVDQPESQKNKLTRLSSLDYPKDAATYVTCDFEHEDFLDRLTQAGYDSNAPALFVWEGVTTYLTEAAVRATLRRIATGTHPESMVVFDHLRRKIVSGDVSQKDLESRAFVADLGEPLRFGIDYPLPLLYEEGFRKVRTITFDEIALDLTGTYERDRAFRFQGIVVASRAATPAA